jgi:hypothetical protein
MQLWMSYEQCSVANVNRLAAVQDAGGLERTTGLWKRKLALHWPLAPSRERSPAAAMLRYATSCAWCAGACLRISSHDPCCASVVRCAVWLFFLQSAAAAAVLSPPPCRPAPGHWTCARGQVDRYLFCVAGPVLLSCIVTHGHRACSKARRPWTRSASPGRTGLRSPVPFCRGLANLIKADCCWLQLPAPRRGREWSQAVWHCALRHFLWPYTLLLTYYPASPAVASQTDLLDGWIHVGSRSPSFCSCYTTNTPAS